ncbi:MAG: hypothetical protein JWM12_3166, partial [Ilumatobacteraceae bacterium]|nr:hypothetical protein [Ilumatobacteraceae bacterium]
MPLVFGAADDIVAGTRDFFAGAAQHLVDTDFADAHLAFHGAHVGCRGERRRRHQTGDPPTSTEAEET